MDSKESMVDALKTSFEQTLTLKEGDAATTPEAKPTGAAGDSTNFFEVFKAEGNAFVKTERYVEALLKYEQAWDVCGSDDDRAMILNNRGVVYDKLGETDRALEIFNEALVLKPAYLKVLLRRALVYKKLKNFDKAIDDLSEVQVLGMKQGQQVTGILECVAELFKEYVDEELEKIRKARTFDFPKSFHVEHHLMAFYCDPVSAFIRNPDSLEKPSTEESGFVTAINLVKAKEFSKVPEQCTAEIERNGKYKLEALNLRGSIYFVTGKHEEAVADFQAIIEDESASNEAKSSAHLKAALSHNIWTTSDATAYHFAEAEKLWKQNADVYYHASVCLVDRGEGMPANVLLEKGIQECPDPKQNPLLHALRLSMQSSFDACMHGNITAGEILTKLKEIESYFDNPDCYEIAAQAFLLLSESDNAAEMLFDKAVEVSGGLSLYKLKKSMANLLKTDDRDGVIKALEEFAKDPEVASMSHFHMAEIQLLMNEFDKAMEHIEKSVEAATTIYDVKLRLVGKIDFIYNIEVSKKMKEHGVNIFGNDEETNKALE